MNKNNTTLSAERMEDLLRSVIAAIQTSSDNPAETQKQLEALGFTREDLMVLGVSLSNEERIIMFPDENTLKDHAVESESWETDGIAFFEEPDQDYTISKLECISDPSSVILTTHSKQRMKERCGFKKKSKQRMAERVFLDGITPEETNGNLKKWLEAVTRKNTDIDNLRLYGDKIYLFADRTLVTVFWIPKQFMSRVNQIAQKKRMLRKEA